MRVVLLQPPQWDPSHPYLSLPSLASGLRAKGHTVILRDVGVDSFNYFLTPSVLQGYYTRVLRRMGELRAQSALSSAEREELALLTKVDAYAPLAIQQVPEACRVFRSDAFYDYETYWRSMMIFFRATEIISACHFPSRLTFAEFEMRYRCASTEEVLQAIFDRKENPFISFFETYVPDRVLAEDPDLLGISFTAQSQLIPGLTLARIIAECAPEVPIVAGGAHISNLLSNGANFAPFFEYIDGFSCYGGELPIQYLAHNIDQGRGGVETVPNFAHYKNGKVVINRPYFEEDLDRLLTPDFDGMPLGSYLAPDLNLPLISSKGCYWARCAFCGYCASTEDMRYFQRAAAKVVQDVETLKERHGCRAFSFGDDCVSPQRSLEISRGLIARGSNIVWDAFTRHDKHWTPEICKAMADSGCRRVYFGLESGSERILRLMRKGTNLRLIARVWRQFKEAGISVHAFCMGGFPTETEAEALETVRFLCEHHELVDSMSFLPFTLIPPARIAKDPGQFGVRLRNRDGDFDVSSIPYDPPSWHPQGNWDIALDYLPNRVMEGLRAKGVAETRYQQYKSAGYIAGHRFPPLKGQEFLYYAFPDKRTPSRGTRRAQSVPLPSSVLTLANSARLSCAPDSEGRPGDAFLYDGTTGQVIALSKAAYEAVFLCDGNHDARAITNTLLNSYGADLEAESRIRSLLQRLLEAGVLVEAERS